MFYISLSCLSRQIKRKYFGTVKSDTLVAFRKVQSNNISAFIVTHQTYCIDNISMFWMTSKIDF